MGTNSTCFFIQFTVFVSLYFFICKICGMLVDKVWCGYDAGIEPVLLVFRHLFWPAPGILIGYDLSSLEHLLFTVYNCVPFLKDPDPLSPFSLPLPLLLLLLLLLPLPSLPLLSMPVFSFADPVPRGWSLPPPSFYVPFSLIKIPPHELFRMASFSLALLFSKL